MRPKGILPLITVAVLAAVLVFAGLQFARWRARQIVTEQRVTGTTQLLCRGLEDYREATGHLPVVLDQITNSPFVDAAWLHHVTNMLSVTYKPGPSDGDPLPRLKVSDGRTCVTVAGPHFRYDAKR